MTEHNDKDDRVEANNWYDAKDALAALDRLKFAYGSLVEMTTKPGSCERENAFNAELGIKHRINYLHDSLRRLLKDKL